MYKFYRLFTVVILIMLLPNCEGLDSLLNEDESDSNVEAANSLVAEANETVFDDLQVLMEEEISENAYDSPGTEIKTKLD